MNRPIELPQISPLLPNTFTLFKVDVLLDPRPVDWSAFNNSESFLEYSTYLSPCRYNDVTFVDSFDKCTADTAVNRPQYFIKPKCLEADSFSYCVIQCYKWSPRSKVKALFANFDSVPEERIEFDGGFGQWTSLINRRCVIPNWGLRVLASERFCNPKTVKKICYWSSLDRNPLHTEHYSTKLSELHNKLKPDDSLLSIRVIPSNIHFQETDKGDVQWKVYEVRDYLQFILPYNKSLREIPQSFVTDFRDLAKDFYDFIPSIIHQDLKPYVFEQVTDFELLQNVRSAFLDLPFDENFIFPHKKFFASLGITTPWFSKTVDGERRKFKEFLQNIGWRIDETFFGDVIDFNSNVYVWRIKSAEQGTHIELKLLDYVFSKLFEFEEKMYFLELGSFFVKPQTVHLNQ
ncbi:hypothetical protein P9112_000440 [Eukaryota sp. TZLM1-RC]